MSGAYFGLTARFLKLSDACSDAAVVAIKHYDQRLRHVSPVVFGNFFREAFPYILLG